MRFLPFLFLVNYLFIAAEVKAQSPALRIAKAEESILVDGNLNEKVWMNADSISDFWQNFPFDTSLAKSRTVVKMTYDKDNIYVAAICYDKNPGPYIIQSLKRDWSYPVSDAFVVTLDPFGDLTNGFSFGVNPYGVQREGLVQFGGGQGVTTAWDNIWYAETQRLGDRWTVEMAIPYKSIRYKTGLNEWKVNFARNDLKENESSSWIKVPRNLNISTLAFSGSLIWDQSPQKAGTNIALIPYGIVNGSQDFSGSKPKEELKPNAGFDAKVAINSSLNLDLTFNPDFAQVEVDRQVTNLSRFNIFFPERRYFFLENSDLFERFGFRQIRPFFSRTIGLNNGNVIPIIGGARLSGKINRKWRIGAMNMQTAKDTALGIKGQNYTVAAFQYQLKGRSNISGIFVNRQAFDDDKISFSDFNRMAGVDFNLASMNGRWNGKGFFHHSFSPNNKDNSFAHATWLNYSDPNWMLEWNHEYVGNNYNAEVGYVPRIDFFDPIQRILFKKSYLRFEPYIRYKFYPKYSIVNNRGPELYLSYYLDGAYKQNEYQWYAGYQWSFQNTSKFSMRAISNFVLLYFDTDITFSGNVATAAGNYTYYSLYAEYLSDKRKTFNFEVHADAGQYFSGYKYTYSVDASYRVQPWGIFSLSMQNNHLIMPDPITDRFFVLIGPKVELSFTRKLFFTTFFQYNTQIKNFNINSRLQWRFRPMSDLYLVYTENYNALNVSIKNRAVALKLVYWLNL